MTSHNVCFHGERKNINPFWLIIVLPILVIRYERYACTNNIIMQPVYYYSKYVHPKGAA